MIKNLLIVESPSKAKTIEKYLGKEWRVLATFGHVRDLPSKNGSVETDNDFFMHYQITINSKKHISAIYDFILDNNSEVEIFLATDPDREGEAIAWHVVECIKLNKKINLSKIKIKRAVFNAITKEAIKKAISQPRDLDLNLVNAQQSRLALDYLVGFTVSPILWKTVGGIKASAGRVQSVALRILVERELEILNFKSQEYWTIQGDFKSSGISLNANLIVFDSKKLEKFTFKNQSEVNKALKIINSNQKFSIKDIERKQHQKNPYPPFTTSSLQQEASKRLGFNSKKTMSIAQKLYEGISIKGSNIGLITYMRTDGLYVTDDAINSTRDFVEKKFGNKYLPNTKRLYQNKIKNAQEAHEAIRPTNITSDYNPESIKEFLTNEEFNLYQLIWKRMIASQMSSAIYDNTNVFIQNDCNDIEFKSAFSNLIFDGFFAAYEYKDEDDLETKKIDLSTLKINDEINLIKLIEKQHFTEPPAKYNEAGLIKKMEEIGIGRPSTYATIVSILQTREYVKLVQKRFQVTIRGHVITTFLIDFFPKYFAYDFTAKMENELDEIANGTINWKKLLHNFWNGFNENTKEVSGTEVSKIMNKVSDDMMKYLFLNSEKEDCIENSCPSCLENNRENGKLLLKFSRFGYFIGCSNHPTCQFIKSLNDNIETQDLQKSLTEKTEDYIFENSTTKVKLKKGRYGDYLEVEKNGDKKNIGLTNEIAKNLNSETIEKLIELPKFIENHPNDNLPITVNLGPYGFYIAHNKSFASIDKKLNPFEITISKALEILEKNEEKNKKNTKILESNSLGKITIKRGGYGNVYYLDKEEKRILLPKDISFSDPDLSLIENFIENKSKKKTRKKSAINQ